MKRMVPIFAALLLFPFTSLADPSPGLRWLQRDPITLFDFGIYKLNSDFRKMVEKGHWKRWLDESGNEKNKHLPKGLSNLVEYDYSMVSYDFEKNIIAFTIRISIKKAVFNDTFENLKKENQRRKSFVNPEVCEKVIKSIKEQLQWSLALNPQRLEIWFKSYFSHEGYQRSKRPKSIELELIKISKIETIMSLSGSLDPPLFCSMPIAGGAISIIKNYKF